MTSLWRSSTIAAPDPAGDVVERLVPAHALPAVAAARARAPQRIQDAVGVGDLVERRRALGAVAPARARVLRVALELAHLQRLAVDVGEQPARRLAVEARRRDEHEALLHALRPRARVELDPVVPALLRRERGQVHAARARGRTSPRAPRSSRRAALTRVVQRARGRSCQRHRLAGLDVGVLVGEQAEQRRRAPRRRPATARRARPRRARAPPRTRARSDRASSRARPAARARSGGRWSPRRPRARGARAPRRRAPTRPPAARPARARAAAPASAAWTSRWPGSSGLCHRSRARACANRYAV